jgi:lantibiotic modifying enzyme
VDLGLAHGLPGPLALLALALRRGIAVPAQQAAMRQAAAWLVERRVEDEWGLGWPAASPLTPGNQNPTERTRTAWCYGSPGVARALWLCADALDDPQLASVALDAMAAVYRRPLAERGIDVPTLCHGVAGLLQITMRFRHDTRHPMFQEAALALAEQLVALHEPDACLGYRASAPGERRVENPGVLYGSAGVVLALLAAATDVEPTWDRLLLLA